MSDKIILRRESLCVRNELSKTQRTEKSGLIRARLTALEAFEKADHVLLYFTHGSEVDTIPLIAKYLKTKQLYLPVIKDETQFHAAPIQRPLDLNKGPMGIKEPTLDEDHLDFPYEKKIEVVIVPGVAFDRHGHRLGTGKGYYDRYLDKCKGALTIGLAFEEQMLDEIPIDSYDVGMNMVITDGQIYHH